PMLGPFLRRTHRRDDATGSHGGLFEVEGTPAIERCLHPLARRLPPQHVEPHLPMMREVRVQADMPAVAGAVEPGDRVPQAARAGAVDAQIPLATEFYHGMAGVEPVPIPTSRLLPAQT